MGYYTQFVIECELRDDTPQDIIQCINDMVSDAENTLFTYSRNPLNDYCGDVNKTKSFMGNVLKAHGELKNYWGDIDRFVIFIRDYIKVGLLDNGYFAKSIGEEGEEYNDGDWTYYGIV